MSNYITLEHLDQTVWSIVQKINQVKDSIAESDPVFAASPAAGITQNQINNWNNNMFSLNAPENGISYLLLGANSQNDHYASILPVHTYVDDSTVTVSIGADNKSASLAFSTYNQYRLNFTQSNITSDRTYYLPDKTGTIALDSDIPTLTSLGAAASIHTHGNITNAGDITTNVAIASGDRLVINDESQAELNNSSITFGTDTTQYLSNNGTWQTIPSWALASTKPTYTASEVNAVPYFVEAGQGASTGKIINTASSIKLLQSKDQAGNSSITMQGSSVEVLSSATNAASTQTASIILSTQAYHTANAIQNIVLSDGTTTINGVITPTSDSMAANKKYVDDAVASIDAAASSHTHGNITNTGDITTIAAIASGDRLVINDESESKLNNSSITFGTKTTQYLANNGTWQNLTQLYKYAGSGDGKVSVNSNQVTLEASTESPTFTQNTLTLTGTATTIKKVVTPTEDGDAANKKYVDDTVASVAASGGVSITNTLSSGTLIATINGTNIYAPAYTDADGVSY